MPRHPLIGMTTYGRGTDDRFRLPADYVDAVRRAGGVPVLIPPGGRVDQLVEELDGWILSGGGDIDPGLYDGVPHATIERVDAERDASEIELAKLVVERDLPALFICRGAQVLNVALGGTLVEHLPDEVGDVIQHRAEGGTGSYPRHAVAVEPGSRLAAIMGSDRAEPASWHHQAVRRLAPGLTLTARAEDGTIEAFEKPDRQWLIAVQWHPEVTAGEDPTQQRLFDGLVGAAARRRRQHPGPWSGDWKGD
jgi:putative glutamine amidotransferase